MNTIMNKICVSNKKSVINLFVELTSTIDDQDKSNSFHIQKFVNFIKEESFALKKVKQKKLNFPIDKYSLKTAMI